MKTRYYLIYHLHQGYPRRNPETNRQIVGMEIPGVKGKGDTLQELKANMREVITSALRTMKRESEEWGGKEMVIELSV